MEDARQGGVNFSKEEGGCDDDNDESCFVFCGGEASPTMLPPNEGQRQQRWRETTYTFPSGGTCGGNNGQQIDNGDEDEAIVTPPGLRCGCDHRHNTNNN
jgi:hypothetical protein